jgi:hypothetical protein
MKYTKEKWAEYINRPEPENKSEVDSEIYFYFLEVLPPIWINKDYSFNDGAVANKSFGFAEGYEPITVFWEEDGKYFSRRSKKMNAMAFS